MLSSNLRSRDCLRDAGHVPQAILPAMTGGSVADVVFDVSDSDSPDGKGIHRVFVRPHGDCFAAGARVPNPKKSDLGFGVLERPFPHSILLFSGALIWIFGILAEV